MKISDEGVIRLNTLFTKLKKLLDLSLTFCLLFLISFICSYFFIEVLK